MTTAEFRALPEDMRIARVYYDANEHKFVADFYDHNFYKNWGHWYREAVNKYDNHFIYYLSNYTPAIVCTEDKYEIAMKNFRNALIKQQNQIIEDAENAIDNIKSVFDEVSRDTINREKELSEDKIKI